MYTKGLGSLICLPIDNSGGSLLLCPKFRLQAPHKVNLNNPEKTILVNLLKNACGVAVVEQFRQLSKFNIRVLTTPPEEDKEGEEGKKAAEASAKDGGKGSEAEEGTDAVAGAAGKGGGGATGEGKQQEQEQVEEQPHEVDQQEPEQRT